MRIVVAGCGRTGALTAQMLSESGHDVTVIDQDERAFRRLGPDFGGRTIRGNAIDPDTLRLADVGNSDVYLAATTGDNRNIMTSQIAKQMFGAPRVIARIKDPVRAEIYSDLGIEVDCRTIAGTQTVLDSIGIEIG